MAITPLPIPPLRSDPTNFAARGDAFLGALPKFQVEANALAVAMNLNSTTDSSTSSITIGTGAKTFVVSSGKSFQPGMYLVLADTSAPSTNSMFGQITSYSGTSLVMSIISVRGSGTITSWTISQSSAGGAQAGPLASSGITGAAASGVNTDIISITGNAATATTSRNGSDNAFLTAGTGASGTQNLIGANCSGYSPAYLYNAGFGWGLFSDAGGVIIEYNRGSGKTQVFGNATTATTAATAATATSANNLNGTNHNVQGSRVANTNYSNTSGKTMIVTICLSSTGAQLATLFVDFLPVWKSAQNYAMSAGSLTAVVPNGSFYSLANSGAINSWCEYY